MIRSVLVVCIGNICRSPMAEGLLRAELENKVEVHSAGLGALIGKAADSHAQTLMEQLGIDISDHRAQQLNGALCKSVDLILVMDNDQKKEIESLYPYARGRVYRLGDAAGVDIFDPYKRGIDDFERCLLLIRSGVVDWAKKIRSLY